MRHKLTLTASCLVCGACTAGMHTNLPTGQQAYAIIPSAAFASAPQEYVIGPLDTLSIEVFQEPELSAKDVQVDAAGNLLLPLIGTVHVRTS